MSNVDIDLQKKVDALGLHVVDDVVYKEHLKAYEQVGIDVTYLTYYKWYGKCFVPYSKDYLLSSTMEELLKRDNEKYKQYKYSFLARLKGRLDVWILKGKLKLLGGLAKWGWKRSKDGE
ncbi:hypothetical protein [Bacillus sp. FSL K6-0067]|uniref:hypothetical protein n=1 Tax=Bacillus sp. FSL K6-0067 TaxID=2921412 RepID=UPI0030FCD6F8